MVDGVRPHAEIVMIKELGFNDKQKELYELMSDISEDCYCAGWMIGNESAIYSAMRSGNLNYGISSINQNSLNRVRELSNELNGWIIWFDDMDDESLPSEDWGPRFVTMDEWLKIYSDKWKYD